MGSLVRCSSMEPNDPIDRVTTHAPSRTWRNNSNQRTENPKKPKKMPIRNCLKHRMEPSHTPLGAKVSLPKRDRDNRRGTGTTVTKGIRGHASSASFKPHKHEVCPLPQQKWTPTCIVDEVRAPSSVCVAKLMPLIAQALCALAAEHSPFGTPKVQGKPPSLNMCAQAEMHR